ncbi:MAG: hypothetical protein K0R57_558 [Paenibacillaceae bacterium]|jgi:hypothetical protein|nr:hypothetical protein [Paenibacillaceae bacterium]
MKNYSKKLRNLNYLLRRKVAMLRHIRRDSRNYRKKIRIFYKEGIVSFLISRQSCTG